MKSDIKIVVEKDPKWEQRFLEMLLDKLMAKEDYTDIRYWEEYSVCQNL